MAQDYHTTERLLHPRLISAGAVLFVAVLATDVLYWWTLSSQWETFSIWLLASGLIVAALAGAALLVELVIQRSGRIIWRPFLGLTAAALLSLLNAFVHSRDGYTAVIPQGLELSGLVTVLLLIVGWRGWSLSNPRSASPPQPRAASLKKGLLHSMWALASLLVLSACDQKVSSPDTQYGANPDLPAAQQYVLPPMRIAPVVGWGEDRRPVVPDGLQVRAFATGFRHPRSVYTLPNGDVLVVETDGPKAPINRPKDYVMGIVKGMAGSATPAGNRIILLRDRNGDGQPDLRTVFIDHLNSPFGVILVGDQLYVADTDAILRFPYVPGETGIAAPPARLTDLPAGPINHHWTKSLTASPDGMNLYVGVGSNSNITENGIDAEADRAAIWEIDRATGLKRLFATGLRNPTGLAFEPQTNKLWAVVNERDEIGPNLVPDYLTSVQERGFYGWPYSYFGQHVDVRVQPPRPDLVAAAISPDYALSSHVAPLGMVFSQASGLPARYRSGVFVSEHGSWDRSPLNGYKVVYVPFMEGRPSGPPQDVVTGFLTPDGRANGRPVGIALDHTGSLLIADDVGNVVWRVSTGGKESVAMFDLGP